jgi:hypothetical protein
VIASDKVPLGVAIMHESARKFKKGLQEMMPVSFLTISVVSGETDLNFI